jgi:hypothetical protein
MSPFVYRQVRGIVAGFRKLPDSFPPILSCSNTDKFSSASFAWSQYSPLLIGPYVDSPDRKPYAPETTRLPWWRCRGQVLKQGRTSQPVGILLGPVVCIRAICVRVHSQISFPAPHSVRRCIMVSCLPHCVQFSVSISLILRSLMFVGIKSCITLYHADLASSIKLILWRLPHTTDQSIAVWSCMMRISRGLFPAVDIVGKVSYTCRLTFRNRASYI